MLGAVTYAAGLCHQKIVTMRWHILIAPPGLFTYSVMIEGTKESIGRKSRSRMERGENREEKNALSQEGRIKSENQTMNNSIQSN